MEEYKEQQYGPPPIGVKPKMFWLEERALDLSESIIRYLRYEGFSDFVYCV